MPRLEEWEEGLAIAGLIDDCQGYYEPVTHLFVPQETAFEYMIESLITTPEAQREEILDWFYRGREKKEERNETV